MTRAYYNEIDAYVAKWLRNLIADGLLPAGDVDERDIRDVRPDDLAGYTQCHFFAGIGGWPFALRLAGWPDGQPVWTGSCPCQRFSSATRGRGVAEDLWPAWRHLIAERKPCTVFGEQVAAASDWFDGVCDDMEGMDYEIGADILTPVAIGADHARPRIYFACHADRDSQPGCALNAKALGMSGPRSDARRVVPANGVPARVAALRAFGNAIHAELGAEFVRSYMEREAA